MNEQNTITAGATVASGLSVNFVQADYFLVRIRQFEVRYHEKFHSWGEFLAEYSKGTLDKNNLDYDEWAYLCRHFLPQLIELEGEAPPGLTLENLQKPESDSGFCFWRRVACSSRSAISQERFRNWRDVLPAQK